VFGSRPTIRIFAQKRLSDFLDAVLRAMKQEVDGEPRNNLLNANQEDYVDYLVSRYSVEALTFEWERVSVSDREVNIPAERFPSSFCVRRGGSYPKQVITYAIPFAGDPGLLEMQPSTFQMWTEDVEVWGGVVRFDVICWNNDAEQVRREAERTMGLIRQNAGNVEAQVTRFNSDLRAKAEGIVVQRRAALLQQTNMLEKLGVSLASSADVPSTFTVPIRKARPIVAKPQAPDAPFAPEPCLDDDSYKKIPRVCFDAGREMERHPSIYCGRGEETLRDHFLMVLAPHFQSVTGETFNCQGKTDVLVRHEGKNLFVAECKYWHGAKALQAAIDQTLGYLTWRDSKAALILFVPNREIAGVLSQIEIEVPKHGAWVQNSGRIEEGWYSFVLHLPGDRNRHVKLAVLCFHFPAEVAPPGDS